jgi:hypothetical protein
MSNSDLSRPGMNKPSVTDLYRRFTDGASVLDTDQLSAQMASSPARARLPGFSRDLEVESAALSAKLALALSQANEAVAHRRHGVSRRAAAGSRRWRAVAAMAAAVIAAVVVWGGHHGTLPTPVTPMASAPTLDRIFAGFDENAVATTGRADARDEIFRGEFRSDEIFNSSAKTHDG